MRYRRDRNWLPYSSSIPTAMRRNGRITSYSTHYLSPTDNPICRSFKKLTKLKQVIDFIKSQQ